MVICYHLTTGEHLESIKKNGLIPKIGKYSEICNEDIPRIYLFPDLQYAESALDNWNWFDDEDEVFLLELQVPAEMLEDGEAPFEMYAYETISPSCIKNIYDEYDMTDLFQGDTIGTTRKICQGKESEREL